MRSPVSTRQKSNASRGRMHLLHLLHSLHARFHSTPHDQTSARCGRWAAEASQEAACLLTTVGAAVEQANPGSVTTEPAASGQATEKNEAANRAPPGRPPAPQSPTKPRTLGRTLHAMTPPPTVTQPSANDSSRHIRAVLFPVSRPARLALAPRQHIAADFRG